MVSTRTKSETSKNPTKDASLKQTSSRDIPDKLRKKDPEEGTSSKVRRKSLSRASPSRLTKSPPASPAKSTRAKSPGRKSPSRTSPARRSSTARSPRRKSPARKVILDTVTTKASVGRPRKLVVDVESDSDNADMLYHVEKPKAAVRGRARRLDTEKQSLPKVVLHNIQDSIAMQSERYVGVVRRSVQRSPPPEPERIVHLRHDPAIKKLSEFSEEDDIPLKEKLVPVRHVELKVFKDRQEVGVSGTIGALLTICFAPLFIIMLHISCNETHCSLTKLPSLPRCDVSTFLDANAFLLFIGLSTLVAILSVVPFAGRKVSGMPNKQGKLNYTMNGPFIAAVTFLIAFVLEYFNESVVSTVLQKYFQLIISGIIIGCFISVYLYIKSYFVPVSALNPLAVTNSHLHNFNVGREQNPRILKYLDVKLVLSRIFLISTILLNVIFVYKSLEEVKFLDEVIDFDFKFLTKLNATLLIIGTLQIIYCLDLLIFEPTTITSSYVQRDGCGYFVTVSSIIGAFSFVSVTKYVYDFNITLPVWQLVLSVLLFCGGYFIYRRSNQEKHAFRLNPYSPSISHLESIPTQGKKLLVSGLWGIVRHPNYLGDIMMQLSFAVFALTKPPALACLFDILYLVFRARQDGERCKRLYGSAWNLYCQRVKYVLIPKVY